MRETARENGTLKLTRKVYIFQGKKTTSIQQLDEWLEDEYDMFGTSIPYRKIKGVKIEEKVFEEKAKPENPHKKRKDSDANTAEKLDQITSDSP